MLGAIGLILPRALNIAPVLTPLAAVGCAIVMIGAVVTHIRMKDYKGTGMPVCCSSSRSSSRRGVSDRLRSWVGLSQTGTGA